MIPRAATILLENKWPYAAPYEDLYTQWECITWDPHRVEFHILLASPSLFYVFSFEIKERWKILFFEVLL